MERKGTKKQLSGIKSVTQLEWLRFGNDGELRNIRLDKKRGRGSLRDGGTGGVGELERTLPKPEIREAGSKNKSSRQKNCIAISFHAPSGYGVYFSQI